MDDTLTELLALTRVADRTGQPALKHAAGLRASFALVYKRGLQMDNPKLCATVCMDLYCSPPRPSAWRTQPYQHRVIATFTNLRIIMGDIEKLAGSVASLQASFEEHRYICSDEIATAVFLAYQLRKPILIEGPPGVGKTELAKPQRRCSRCR